MKIKQNSKTGDAVRCVRLEQQLKRDVLGFAGDILFLSMISVDVIHHRSEASMNINVARDAPRTFDGFDDCRDVPNERRSESTRGDAETAD